MNTNQLRQVDLNLLVVFAVFAEERSVSAAARRLLLTQPAVSRALNRLRSMFGDDLFIRGKAGYELTPHAVRIMQELEHTLPSIDRLVRGSEFDPRKEAVVFKLACTDYATSILGPNITQRLIGGDSKASLCFAAFSESVYRDLAQGHVDLVFQVHDETIPLGLETEKLFEEEMVCIVPRSWARQSRLTLNRYAASGHIVVSLHDSSQAFPDKVLRRLSIKRKSTLKVPHFMAALACVQSTNLIATVPKRFATTFAHNFDVNVVGAPREFGHFEYWMAWHPRLNSDAAHQWLRREVRLAARSL